MAKQDKNTGKKSKAELAREEEKLRILARTDEVKGEQLLYLLYNIHRSDMI